MVYSVQMDIERHSNQSRDNVEDGQQPSRIPRFLANHRSRLMKLLPLHRVRNLFVHKLPKHPRLITIPANRKEACLQQLTANSKLSDTDPLSVFTVLWWTSLPQFITSYAKGNACETMARPSANIHNFTQLHIKDSPETRRSCQEVGS